MTETRAEYKIDKKVEVKMVEWFDDLWYKLDIMNNGILETHWLPSVTTKLGIVGKPFLAKWRGEIGNREADQRLFYAQERGTRIHHGFNVWVTGGIVIYNPWQHPNYQPEDLKKMTDNAEGNAFVCQYQDEMYQLIKLQKWMDAVKPKVMFAEKTVYDLENRDAGTADIGFYIEGGTYMVNGSRGLLIPEGQYLADLKTGSMVSDEANLQTACYAKCAEKMGLGKFKGTIILHTSSKNKNGIEGLSTLLRTGDDVENDYKAYRMAAQLWEWKNQDLEPRVFSFPSVIKLGGK